MTDRQAGNEEMRPDRATMLGFLEHAFGGDLDGLHEGLIEIAYSDPATPRELKGAKHFGTDQLEDAAEFACSINARQNVNVFYGAALRRPDIERDSRTGKAGVLGAVILWADWDKEGDLKRAHEKFQFCRPTAGTITGRHPHPRGQGIWRIDTALRETAAIEGALRGLQVALSGDPAVVDAGRVMRLPGSIAWPVKEGRIVELTELHVGGKDQPAAYATEQVLRAFPPRERQAEQPREDTFGQTGGFGGLNVGELMRRIRNNENWHDNMIRLIAHWIWRGWSDNEIIATAGCFALPPHTVAETADQMRVMIRGGRVKWSMPNAEPEFDTDARPPAPLEARYPGNLDFTKLERRRWVLGRRYIERFVTLTIAPGGVGKSTLTMEEAVSIATGRDLTGQKVRRTGKVWVINNEDPIEELNLRLAAICLNWDIPIEEIGRSFAMNSGVDRRLIVAQQVNGLTVAMPDVDGLIAEIKKEQFCAVFVDPFVRCHMVSENDNHAIDFVMQQFGRVTAATGCLVGLVHHARKSNGFDAPRDGDADSARGASALVSASRAAHTLGYMAEKEAERLGIDEKDRRLFVRLDDAKGNMSPPAEGARWFKKKSVTIPNGTPMEPGDEVGVLEPWEPPPPPPFSHTKAKEILDEVKRRWEEGRAFVRAYRGKGTREALITWIMEEYPEHRGEAKGIVDEWETNGIIQNELTTKDKNQRGWRVLRYPG